MGAVWRTEGGTLGLCELRLDDCGLGDDAGRMLARMLHGNRSLLSLQMRTNRLGLATADALFTGLLLNHTLRELALEQNPLMSETRRRELQLMVATGGAQRVRMVSATTQLQCAFRQRRARRHRAAQSDISDRRGPIRTAENTSPAPRFPGHLYRRLRRP